MPRRDDGQGGDSRQTHLSLHQVGQEGERRALACKHVVALLGNVAPNKHKAFQRGFIDNIKVEQPPDRVALLVGASLDVCAALLKEHDVVDKQLLVVLES